MLALLAAMAFQTAAAVVAPPAPAAPAVSAPAMTPQAELVELQRVYADSCDARAYGTYDDVCTNLADQIARFRREMRRNRGRHAAPSAPAPSAASPPTP